MAFKKFADVFAAQVFHDDKRSVLTEPGFVNDDRVFMTNQIRSPSTFDEPGGLFEIARGTRAKEFNRNRRLRLFVDRAINLTNATGSDAFNNSVPAGQDATYSWLLKWRLRQLRIRIAQVDLIV